MVEPFAAGVFSSFLPRPKSSCTIARVLKSTTKPSLTANFFTPPPRQTKGKEKEVDTFHLGHVLDSQAQAWSCPRSKASLWSEGALNSIVHMFAFRPKVLIVVGAMRSLFLGELSPPQSRLSGRQVRRTSQSSRNRWHNSLPSSAIGGSQHRHVAFSTSTSGHQSRPAAASFLPSSYTATTTEISSPIQRIRDILHPSIKSNYNFDALNQAFISAKAQDAFASLSEDELLEIAELLANCIDWFCACQAYPDVIKQWGERLCDLFSSIPKRQDESWGLRLNVLNCRALAFVGELDYSKSFLKEEEVSAESRNMVQASLVLAMASHNGLDHALEFLFCSGVKPPQSLQSIPGFSKLLSESPNLGDTLGAAKSWERHQQSTMLSTVLNAIIGIKGYRTAVKVIERMRSMGIEPLAYSVIRVCQGLAKSDATFVVAQKLFESLPPNPNDKVYLGTSFLLKSGAGDIDSATRLLRRRNTEGALSDVDITIALTDIGKRGRLVDLKRSFESFFPRDEFGNRTRKPNIHHYTSALHSHAIRGDVNAANMYMEEMQDAGLTPNLQTYTVIIKSFMATNDARSISNVFKSLRGAGLTPDRILYTTMISYFAKQKDIRSADALFMEALSKGCNPDDRMVNALMNAHVEAGNWDEVFRIFKHLTEMPTTRHLGIDTYNTLLKSYVMMGAPFRQVLKVFLKVQATGVEPDTYTFALLILSASEAGQLEQATEIFQKLRKRRTETGESMIYQHIYTILISANLRLGNRQEAKTLLDEMIKQRIEPSSQTYGAIVKTYALRGIHEGMEIAEEFVNQIRETSSADKWAKQTKDRKAPLAHIYGPLMMGYERRGDIEGVERVYSKYLDAGGEPTIGLLARLLNTYNQAGDIAKVLELWPVILDIADSDEYEDLIPGERLQSTKRAIDLPLSIYLDALSQAGMHSEVAKTWTAFQHRGFKFDSHNWNHLIVALIRGAQVEPAFQVVEKVLLPKERARRSAFNSALSDSEASNEEKLSLAAALAPVIDAEMPMHNNQDRRVASVLGRSSVSPKLELKEDDEATLDEAFVNPMRILQVIPSTFNEWRPHNIVLRSLLLVVMQLRRGYLIDAVQAGERTTYNVSNADLKHADREAASALLNKLYDTCPDTLSRIKRFERWERERLRGSSFERIYVQR
jgi:pentatricopeptide repeat-containing protein PET309